MVLLVGNALGSSIFSLFASPEMGVADTEGEGELWNKFLNSRPTQENLAVQQ